MFFFKQHKVPRCMNFILLYIYWGGGGGGGNVLSDIIIYITCVFEQPTKDQQHIKQ